MIGFLYLFAGFLMLRHAWLGIVPKSTTLWGKSESGQPMRREQRMLFGFIGIVLFVVGGYTLLTTYG
jgi:hypothetical protein